jgi:hypothetical protein
MVVSSLPHTPVALPPGKELPVRSEFEAEWAPGPVCMLWKRGISSLCRNSNPTPNHFVRRHADRTTAAPYSVQKGSFKCFVCTYTSVLTYVFTQGLFTKI